MYHLQRSRGHDREREERCFYSFLLLLFMAWSPLGLLNEGSSAGSVHWFALLLAKHFAYHESVQIFVDSIAECQSWPGELPIGSSDTIPQCVLVRNATEIVQ